MSSQSSLNSNLLQRWCSIVVILEGFKGTPTKLIKNFKSFVGGLIKTSRVRHNQVIENNIFLRELLDKKLGYLWQRRASVYVMRIWAREGAIYALLVWEIVVCICKPQPSYYKQYFVRELLEKKLWYLWVDRETT